MTDHLNTLNAIGGFSDKGRVQICKYILFNWNEKVKKISTWKNKIGLIIRHNALESICSEIGTDYYMKLRPSVKVATFALAVADL